MARITNIFRRSVFISPYYPIFMKVWGSPIASPSCDVCGRPYTPAHRRGRYLWEGIRSTQLCMWRGGERGLPEARHIAYGVARKRPPDSSTLSLCGYQTTPDGLSFLRWGGWASARRGADRSDPYHTPRNPNAPQNPTLDMDTSGRPRPGGALQTLAERHGKVQLQMALACHRIVLRPT